MTLDLALWIALKAFAACLVIGATFWVVTLAVVGWLTLQQHRRFGRK